MKDIDTVDTAGISSVHRSRVLSDAAAGCLKEQTPKSVTETVISAKLRKKTRRTEFSDVPLRSTQKTGSCTRDHHSRGPVLSEAT
jgi:hypothetical protein